jgi:aldehyde dehydrogenase
MDGRHYFPEGSDDMKYVPPGQPGSIVDVQPRYENFIGGKWLAPTHGKYRVDLAPATAGPITEVADSTPEDVELALDAAHAAKDAWGEASATERAEVLNAIADAVEKNKDMLAVAESWENGKPVRETLAADIPLVVDHFRYFAAAARAEKGRSTEIEKDLVAYHFREPLGVVGQIIPFNFPMLMAAWKLAPALAAGNCSVIKPASPTPWSILKLMETIEDVLPQGVINVVTGPGAEIGKALAANPRIAKVSFTGETVTGRLIMQYAAQNLIPSTVELGGKSQNIFFSDVMAHDDEFLDKAIEGLLLYAFNKGEVCTCPSRAAGEVLGSPNQRPGRGWPLCWPAWAGRPPRRSGPGWPSSRAGPQRGSGHCCVGRSQMAADWSSDLVGLVLSVRWLPVPTRSDLGCGPLVPAVWTVLPGCRGTAG